MMGVQSYDGNFYWLHTDHLGNGRKLTSASGTVVYRAEFDPHGQILYEWQSSGQTYLNSHKFTGYERDWATNLNYAKARTYNHNRGRFLQPDPLSLGAADLTNPQSLNRYSYVENDPMNFVDPSGLLLACFYHYEYRDSTRPDGTLVQEVKLVFDGCFELGGGRGYPTPIEPYQPTGGGGGIGGGNTEPQDNNQKQSSFLDCFEKYRFTSVVGTLFGDTAQNIASAIDLTSSISLLGDVAAIRAKAAGKTLGKPQPYASGLNWVFRRFSSGSLRGALTSVGNKVSPVLAVTAAFTGGYDASIAAQCASGLLK